jgi:glycolate oxidase FAD binding subunit
MSDLTAELRERVKRALAEKQPLELRGGGTRAFYGGEPKGRPLEREAHAGVGHHEPRELVLTARAGTPLAELEALLAAAGQMLPFEPPRFGEASTLGGAIATGLSGSRRPFAGSARDFVLGVKIINGRGEVLRFGGEVMKNVAGYDVSRLMCGALGTLGLLLEVSLKVLPQPEEELTLVQERDEEEAIRLMNLWSGRPLPISAACFDGLHLRLRLSGTPTAVAAGRRRLGGELVDEERAFWRELDAQRLAFFCTDRPLWRLSLPSTTPPLALPGKQYIDWGGAQRWLVSTAPAAEIRRLAEAAGGSATLFRGGDRQRPFHPLPAGLARLHRHLKHAFDPEGLFNPGRLYPEL